LFRPRSGSGRRGKCWSVSGIVRWPRRTPGCRQADTCRRRHTAWARTRRPSWRRRRRSRPGVDSINQFLFEIYGPKLKGWKHFDLNEIFLYVIFGLVFFH
jgi:hypothetical protein